MIVPEGQTHRYEPVGECIYCGDKSALSDEHIIPFGLGGTLILPDASCQACADITSRIERKVLRGFMHGARVVGNFPTRRKKERSKSVKTRLIHAGDATIEQELPVNKAPGFLILPMFARATILDGKPPVEGVTIIGTETIHFGAQLLDVVKDHGAQGIEFGGEWQVSEFAQLLAKIAYSFLVACTGLFPREETPLLSLIRSEADDGGRWVGSHDYTLDIEKQKPQHALAFAPCRNSDGKNGYVVRIKLFASSGTTGYEVAT